MSLDFTIVDVFSDRPFGGNQLAVFPSAEGIGDAGHPTVGTAAVLASLDGGWPMLRRREAGLVAQVRQALGADRFDQAFSAGSRLSQREAVAAVRDRRGASAQPS